MKKEAVWPGSLTLPSPGREAALSALEDLFETAKGQGGDQESAM